MQWYHYTTLQHDALLPTEHECCYLIFFIISCNIIPTKALVMFVLLNVVINYCILSITGIDLYFWGIGSQEGVCRVELLRNRNVSVE